MIGEDPPHSGGLRKSDERVVPIFDEELWRRDELDQPSNGAHLRSDGIVFEFWKRVEHRLDALHDPGGGLRFAGRSKGATNRSFGWRAKGDRRVDVDIRAENDVHVRSLTRCRQA